METKILLLLTYTEHKPSANYHTDGKENVHTIPMYQYYIYQFHYEGSGLKGIRNMLAEHTLNNTYLGHKFPTFLLGKVWSSGRMCEKSQ